MRGERPWDRAPRILADGSSPHARGTRIQHEETILQMRFIPACAGNACLPAPKSGCPTVHPRMRGERQTSPSSRSSMSGSSPHARGTRPIPSSSPMIIGFIPACAGNAISGRPECRDAAVHPRMRGERRARCVLVRPHDGSSPHARGTRAVAAPASGQGRFIPACAGNARGSSGGRWRRPVHPRMRGERACLNRRPCSQSAASERFIPACAGNALDHPQFHFLAAVHPRMRGERGP